MPAPTHPSPAIRFLDVSAGYSAGKYVFEGVSFQIDGPGLVWLRGPNGSGKSTFGELVSGYLRPWQGMVTVHGIGATEPSARANRRVCRAESALFPAMTAHDHLALASRARGVSKGEGLRRAEVLGLGPWLQENAGNLSTGNAKKLWYLMNTLGVFAVLVLDEPFNGVDVEGAAVMAEEVRAWAGERTVILVAHSVPTGLDADVTLDLGRLKDGDPGELRGAVPHPGTAPPPLL